MTQDNIIPYVQEIEEFLRDRLGSDITIVNLGNIVHFQLWDTVYKDDELTQKVTVWWANITLYQSNQGLVIGGELFVDNIYQSFAWDDMRRAEAIDGYRQTNNKLLAELKRIGKVDHEEANATKYPPKWKLHWRKVRGDWERGAKQPELAKAAGVSIRTISKIIKAGNAGLLK